MRIRRSRSLASSQTVWVSIWAGSAASSKRWASLYGRVGGGPAEVYASRSDLDEEQDVETFEGCGIDAEKVGGNDPFGLGLDEFSPCWPCAVGCQVDSGCAENGPDRWGCDLVAESGELTVDTPVTPCGVLRSEVDCESSEFGVGWESTSRRFARVDPMFGDEAFVPGDHGSGLHDQHDLVEFRPREDRREDCEDCPVGVGELWSVDLALEHEDLMAEGKDFGVPMVAGRDEPSETPDDRVSDYVGKSHLGRPYLRFGVVETPQSRRR